MKKYTIEQQAAIFRCSPERVRAQLILNIRALLKDAAKGKVVRKQPPEFWAAAAAELMQFHGIAAREVTL